MFNGYGDQVASLYNGMDLRKYYLGFSRNDSLAQTHCFSGLPGWRVGAIRDSGELPSKRPIVANSNSPIPCKPEVVQKRACGKSLGGWAANRNCREQSVVRNTSLQY